MAVRVYGGKAKDTGRRYSYMARTVFGRTEFSATSAGPMIWRRTPRAARLAAQAAGTFRYEDDQPFVLRDGRWVLKEEAV
jgi:hypothetical protein